MAKSVYQGLNIIIIFRLIKTWMQNIEVNFENLTQNMPSAYAFKTDL